VPYGAYGLIFRYVWLSKFSCLRTEYSKNLPNTRPDFAKTESNIYDSALAHVRAARLTDAEFIYTPSQIALACVSLVAPELADGWLKSKENTPIPENRSDIPPRQSAAAVSTSLEAIRTMITNTGKVPNVEAVREVDRRLRTCKNPEKVVGTKAYLARKAEAEKKAEEKRNRKAEGQNTLEKDPFGDPLAEPAKPGLVDYDDEDDDD
jgi:cyclin H